MALDIPLPLKAEHEELHGELVRATGAGGRTGGAARAVAKVLHPHFVREEEYALPPLGLLKAVARGATPADAAAAIAMAERLEADLPQMLAEHEQIVAALQDLVAAAQAEGQDAAARFAEKLILHARTEEEVLYPATILLGAYLKLRR